ncbi:MAG: DUF3726 domain-containing protein [Rhodospirillaceae bacterium]|nr:DUF3726 domain-containing protein [Rhodospirillaceae bacterium]MYB11636.1 DUF3726 domain-containing protein [Rhodospirillaceae bacterium]MYI49768.1 DUF3726 domain-containing protein [Rhodospirillaceae bacterium]
MPEPLPCSLNEIQSQATKAARGAGLPWGVADEAGRAARWLEARGLAGLSALDGALDGLSAPDWRRCFPVPGGGAWRAESGEIDGLLAGITLADRADGSLPFAGGGALVLDRVRWPLLAVPFLAGIAQARGARLAVSAGPQTPRIGIRPHAVTVSCRAIEGMALAAAVRIEEWGDGGMPPDLPRLDGSVPIDKEVYARLDRRAARTYVPESAESQARGAGGSDLIETD